MIRILFSILAIPFLCNLAAWIGQYTFPAISWGQGTLNYDMGNGVTAMIPQQSPAPFYLFFLPTKLSIPIWAGSLVLSVLIILPCIFIFKKMRWNKLMHVVVFGLLLGLALPATFYVMKPMIMVVPFPRFNHAVIQLFGYCAFLGGFVSVVFWLVAIRRNAWFRKTEL